MHCSRLPKTKRQRTFTGCRTCRRRRVKCDEQKPRCGHCERLKLDCEGYDALLQWLRPIESTRFLEVSEDESSIPLEDQRQSRRQLYSDAQKQAMCLSLYHSGSTVDYNKDICRLEEDCSGNSETFTLGPFGAFNLDIQPSQIATVSESGDVSRDVDTVPSLLDTLVAHESGLVLRHEDVLPDYEHSAQRHSVRTALPDLTNDHFTEVPLEGLEGSDFDANLLWQDLGWQQSSTDLFGGLDNITMGETQNAFVTSASDAGHIQNQLMTGESTYPCESLSHLGSDPLPHIGTLLDLFKKCYTRPGSTWQILQMSEIQKTLGQIALKVKPSTASSAMLLAVLAVMSFHMDRLNTTEARTGYWWHLGENYMSQAVTHVNSFFDDDPPSMDKVRYKTSLMALLTVVAVCLTSGKLEDSRPYLLKTQTIIKRHASREKQKSRKVQLLHALFVYLRVLEEATYIYPVSVDGALSKNVSHIYSVTKYPSLAFKDLLNLQHISPRPDFRDLTVPDFCFEAQNDTIRSLFANTLCLPESLLVLLSHITFVACEARQARYAPQRMDETVLKDFDDRAKVIEDLLCAWTFQGDRQNWSTPESTGNSPNEGSCDSVLEHIALAFHSALLIYFYREVKQINRLILQTLVQQITTHLIDYENSKQQSNIPSNSVIWPGFMAAIEASEEADFARIMGWMRSCADRYGLRAFDRAITAATELRNLRVHTGTDDWPDFMLQKGIFLVLS